MDGDLVKQLILQLPNFVGLLVALYLMREQNLALMELVRECNARNHASTTE